MPLQPNKHMAKLSNLLFNRILISISKSKYSLDPKLIYVYLNWEKNYKVQMSSAKYKTNRADKQNQLAIFCILGQFIVFNIYSKILEQG